MQHIIFILRRYSPETVRIGMLVVVVLASFGAVTVPTDVASAASSLPVRGVVSCPGGKAVVGIWANSSGGGSSFIADYDRFPGQSHVAVFHGTLSTNLPTTLRLDVGCGGTKEKWGSNNKTPSLAVPAGASSRTINAWCEVDGTCAWAHKENNDPKAPKTNPFGTCWCTYRAAEIWEQWVGRYPNWGGDAALWDTNAANAGWDVKDTPRPRALFVSQGTANNPAGHVGGVDDVRIKDGKVQIKIRDRNSNFACNQGKVYDRNDYWMNVQSGMKFIIPPPSGAV